MLLTGNRYNYHIISPFASNKVIVGGQILKIINNFKISCKAFPLFLGTRWNFPLTPDTIKIESVDRYGYHNPKIYPRYRPALL